MDVLTTLVEIGRHNGGVVSRAQACAAGVSDQHLTRLVQIGLIARVAHGVYAVGVLPPSRADPRAVTPACKVVLSHESAAAWYGVDLPAPVGRLHVTASRNRGRRSNAIPGAQLHRANLSQDEVTVVRGVATTTPLRTAIDVSRHSSPEHAVAIVDAFIRARLVRYEDFVVLAAKATGAGAARVKLVASLVCPKAGSILESLTRVLLWRNGLPQPTPQHPFTHRVHGLIGYVDFAWPELKVILECDGYEFHSARLHRGGTSAHKVRLIDAATAHLSVDSVAVSDFVCWSSVSRRRRRE